MNDVRLLITGGASFIPVIIYKALNNQKIPVYGKGLNVREWLYVSDCAGAVLAVIEKGKNGKAYNIGSGNERQNIDVAKTILDVLGESHELIEFVADRPGTTYVTRSTSIKSRMI